MRWIAAVIAASLLASCAGAYVAADGGAHTTTVRTGEKGSR
ncbi:MAG TPA: hypothetical protein VFN88_04840 [Caulobacteraceae bacterium]|nr:hypothetical protein [Caulobacteraceae bacterium]